MGDMSAPESTASAGAPERHFEWWHHSHPTFAAISGFFSGMLFVTALPGAFVGLLRLLFSYERAEAYFPFILIALVLPAVPWYSLLVLAVGVSAQLDPANRTLADRAARTVVIQRGQGCALPG